MPLTQGEAARVSVLLTATSTAAPAAGWGTLLSHPLKGLCQRGKIDDTFLAHRAVLSQFPKPSQW